MFQIPRPAAQDKKNFQNTVCEKTSYRKRSESAL